MLDEKASSHASHVVALKRRAENRTTTVFRPVIIETEEFAGFCLVRNLSPNGMMGNVYTQIVEGLPVSVRFNDDLLMRGNVMWSKNGQVGIKFDETIDVSEILSAIGKKNVGKKVNRAPRLPIRCQGELEVDDRIYTVDVQNISQRGLNLNAKCYLAPGQEAFVRLDGLEDRKVVVRWAQNGRAGVNFIRPLGFGELAEWVIGLQSHQPSASSAIISNERESAGDALG